MHQLRVFLTTSRDERRYVSHRRMTVYAPKISPDVRRHANTIVVAAADCGRPSLKNRLDSAEAHAVVGACRCGVHREKFVADFVVHRRGSQTTNAW